MIYDKEKQFSHNITPKSGGNRKKKYSRHRPSRKSSAIKRRSRRPPPPHITQTNIKQFSHYVS
jgi:hypothetical protein